MEQAGASTYWCHVCLQRVNPIMEIESMKCPICESGFVEETASTRVNETPLDLDRPDIDRALSLWAPILLGMMANPINHRPSRQLEPEEEDNRESPNPNDDQDSLTTRTRRRRRRSSAIILQILQGIRAGLLSEYANLERDNRQQRDIDRNNERMIMINPFNQGVIVQRGGTGGSGGPNHHGPLGDYLIGPGLDLLIQHLTENDPNRYGTPPARKEAVEALKTVKVEAAMQLQCCVCLDECEVGGEVKEMPCKHKFHSTCIEAWLQLHSSCPICRYQLPPDESRNGDNGRRHLLWPSSGNSSLALPSGSHHH